MLELLQYATSGFWVWIGSMGLIGATGVSVALIVDAIRKR